MNVSKNDLMKKEKNVVPASVCLTRTHKIAFDAYPIRTFNARLPEERRNVMNIQRSIRRDRGQRRPISANAF